MVYSAKVRTCIRSEGFLYKRQGIFRFFYWNEIEDITSFDSICEKETKTEKENINYKNRRIP